MVEEFVDVLKEVTRRLRTLMKEADQLLDVFDAMAKDDDEKKKEEEKSKENDDVSTGFGIYVKFMSAAGQPTRRFPVLPSTTVGDVKAKIEGVVKVDRDFFYLVYQSQVLEDDRTLSDYNIQKESTLFASCRIKGIVLNYSKR